MNFYQRQHNAKKMTRALIGLFIFSLVVVIVTINAIVWGIFQVRDDGAYTFDILALTTGATFSVILFGTLSKAYQLRGGGSAVARTLGGRLLGYAAANRQERVLLNVVEEMAIAAGTIVPTVYLMDNEPRINAFAAGHHLKDTVLGFTEGAVSGLSRDELQGVVAHEFSHVLHGDVALNMRVMKVIHGLVMISYLGDFLMECQPRSGFVSRSNYSSKNGAGFIVIGLGIKIIGSIGVFCGNMIRAAMSRQREYLADASAVQYTRNPAGIAGALKKIGATGIGSRLLSPQARHLSFIFFNTAIISNWHTLFETHPPLEKRIRSLEPCWNGEFDYTISQPKLSMESEETKGLDASDWVTIAPALAMREIEFTPDNMAQAQVVLQAIPAQIMDWAHDTSGALALVYSLLLHDDTEEQQMRIIQSIETPVVVETITKVVFEVKNLAPELRLPLIESCLPALHHLSSQQYHRMKALIQALILADARVDLSEWILEQIVVASLNTHFLDTTEHRTLFQAQIKTLKRLRAPISILLSAMVYEFIPEAKQQLAFEAVQRSLDQISIVLLPKDRVGVEALNRASLQLTELKMVERPQVLKAAAVIIDFDDERTPSETAFLRALGCALDCPIPLGE